MIVESEVEKHITPEQLVASKIRYSLHETKTLSPDQIENVFRWIENNKKQNIYLQIHNEEERCKKEYRHQSFEGKNQLNSISRQAIYINFLREALISGGIDRHSRELFGTHYFNPEDE